eukprot:gene5518-11118_t
MSAGCFHFEERPSTPPELQKFRRAAHETGKRYVHPGLIEDVKKLNADDLVYGRKTAFGNTAKDTIASKPQTVVEKLNGAKGEMHSKQHQLGKSLQLGTLPANYNHDKVRGVSTNNFGGDVVKNTIFPESKEDPNKGEEFYRISHRSYKPGEQKTRGYKWDKDPNEIRFGKKSENFAFNGVSKGVTEALSATILDDSSLINRKAVEDFREMGDVLGRTRNRGQVSGDIPFSHAYGSTTNKDEWDAAKIMAGGYTDNEQLPDADLGRSLTPGFRNTGTDDRVYGVPSMRTDLIRNNRSIADSQSYGDDVGARDLITPAPFSDLMMPSDAFIAGKSKEYLIKLFDNIGYSVSDEINDLLFDIASEGGELASVNAYRTVLNEYIVACEMGREKNWLRSKGRK